MTSFAPKAHLTAIVDDWCGYYVKRVKEVMDGTWKTANIWWGLKEGMVQMSPFGPAVTEAATAAANETMATIIDGSAPVFAGPIKDRDGTERVAAGTTLDDGGLWKMDWFVEGVQG